MLQKGWTRQCSRIIFFIININRTCNPHFPRVIEIIIIFSEVQNQEESLASKQGNYLENLFSIISTRLSPRKMNKLSDGSMYPQYSKKQSLDQKQIMQTKQLPVGSIFLKPSTSLETLQKSKTVQYKRKTLHGERSLNQMEDLQMNSQDNNEEFSDGNIKEWNFKCSFLKQIEIIPRSKYQQEMLLVLHIEKIFGFWKSSYFGFSNTGENEEVNCQVDEKIQENFDQIEQDKPTINSSSFYILRSFKEILLQLCKNYIIILVVHETCLFKNNLINHLEENKINYDALYEIKTPVRSKNFQLVIDYSQIMKDFSISIFRKILIFNGISIEDCRLNESKDYLDKVQKNQLFIFQKGHYQYPSHFSVKQGSFISELRRYLKCLIPQSETSGAFPYFFPKSDMCDSKSFRTIIFPIISYRIIMKSQSVWGFLYQAEMVQQIALNLMIDKNLNQMVSTNQDWLFRMNFRKYLEEQKKLILARNTQNLMRQKIQERIFETISKEQEMSTSEIEIMVAESKKKQCSQLFVKIEKSLKNDKLKKQNNQEILDDITQRISTLAEEFFCKNKAIYKRLIQYKKQMKEGCKNWSAEIPSEQPELDEFDYCQLFSDQILFFNVLLKQNI